MRAIARNRDDRYRSVRSLIEALRPFIPRSAGLSIPEGQGRPLRTPRSGGAHRAATPISSAEVRYTPRPSVDPRMGSLPYQSDVYPVASAATTAGKPARGGKLALVALVLVALGAGGALLLSRQHAPAGDSTMRSPEEQPGASPAPGNVPTVLTPDSTRSAPSSAERAEPAIADVLEPAVARTYEGAARNGADAGATGDRTTSANVASVDQADGELGARERSSSASTSPRRAEKPGSRTSRKRPQQQASDEVVTAPTRAAQPTNPPPPNTTPAPAATPRKSAEGRAGKLGSDEF
jgi:hypothetical protein